MREQWLLLVIGFGFCFVGGVVNDFKTTCARDFFAGLLIGIGATRVTDAALALLRGAK